MAARAAARGMASRARAGPPALSPAAYAASLEVEHYASMPLLDLNLTNLQRSIDDGRKGRNDTAYRPVEEGGIWGCW